VGGRDTASRAHGGLGSSLEGRERKKKCIWWLRAFSTFSSRPLGSEFWEGSRMLGCSCQLAGKRFTPFCLPLAEVSWHGR